MLVDTDAARRSMTPRLVGRVVIQDGVWVYYYNYISTTCVRVVSAYQDVIHATGN